MGLFFASIAASGQEVAKITGVGSNTISKVKAIEAKAEEGVHF